MMADHSPPDPGTTYRFEFFRNMVNDQGACFRCMVDTVEIDDADSLEQALASALRIFETRHQLSAWDHLAHGYETHKLSGEEHRHE